MWRAQLFVHRLGADVDRGIDERDFKNSISIAFYLISKLLYYLLFHSFSVFLDFAKPAPVFILIEANWSDYLSRECSQFKEALNRTVKK
jgi:hypothetical protein